MNCGEKTKGFSQNVDGQAKDAFPQAHPFIAHVCQTTTRYPIHPGHSKRALKLNICYATNKSEQIKTISNLRRCPTCDSRQFLSEKTSVARDLQNHSDARNVMSFLLESVFTPLLKEGHCVFPPLRHHPGQILFTWESLARRLVHLRISDAFNIEFFSRKSESGICSCRSQ